MLVYKILFFTFLLAFPLPLVVSAKEKNPSEVQETKIQSQVQHSPTNLGMITVQRGNLESLKLEVSTQEEINKLTELQTPRAVLPSEALIKSLEIPPVDATDNDNDNDTTGIDQKTQLLSVHGTEDSLSAKIRFRGKIANLKQGQFFNGERVRISRDKVSFGSTVLFLE